MNETQVITIATAIITVLLAGIGILWKNNNDSNKEWFKRLDEIMNRNDKNVKEISDSHDKALKDLTEKYDKRQGEINDTMLTAFKQAFGKK